MATENVLQEANIREEKRAMKIVGGGSLAQGFVATGAIALAIIGLAAFQVDRPESELTRVAKSCSAILFPYLPDVFHL